MKRMKVYEITTVDKTKHVVRFPEHAETMLAYLAKAEKNGQKWAELMEDKTEKAIFIRVENITTLKVLEVRE